MYVCVNEKNLLHSVSFLRTNVATVWNNSLKMISCEGGSTQVLLFLT